MSGMQQNGLAKLVEECGEVLQIAGKMIQYPELQMDLYTTHPDGSHLRTKLERELADLEASIDYVMMTLKLNRGEMYKRSRQKLMLYQQWAANNG